MAFLTQVGRFSHTSASEIPAFDPTSRRVFVVNGGTTVDILDLSNPANPTLVSTISAVTLGGAPNSVSVKNGVVAVAVEGNPRTSPGNVRFFDANGISLGTVPVGTVPDMLTFSPDGRKVLVANEGEPSSYNQVSSIDPEGSISIISVPGNAVISSTNASSATVQTAGFTSFNAQADALRQSGVRIFGPNATVAQDLEPEYITLSADSSTAYVTLQENNALAIVNVNTATVTSIVPLGFKNHNLPGNGLDVSDQDGGINIQNRPVFGMYQPDAIASFQANGQTFLITANEGDARDNYPGFNEEVRINNVAVVLDPTLFPTAATLKTNTQLGRLQITNTLGRTNTSPDFLGADVDTEYEALYAFGARSFSIRNTDGSLVFDSGDQLEQITSVLAPTSFNSGGLAIGGDGFDTRSDNKGPEPEGVVTGVVSGRTYAFIGLERVGGVIVYDVTNPASPTFVDYVNAGASDRAPEGLTFVSAADSPNGSPLLIVSNEVGQSTLIYNVGATTPLPITRPTFNGGTLSLGSNSADTIYGTNQSDTIAAFAGNDIIFGALGNDSIDGGFGNDTLIGGLGSDTLIGNIGADVYLYNNSGEGLDTVSFVLGEDSFRLRSLGFGNLAIGTLSAANFINGIVAAAAIPTFLYNGGILSFDIDGTGNNSPVPIANLLGAPALTNTSLTII